LRARQAGADECNVTRTETRQGPCSAVVALQNVASNVGLSQIDRGAPPWHTSSHRGRGLQDRKAQASIDRSKGLGRWRCLERHFPCCLCHVSELCRVCSCAAMFGQLQETQELYGKHAVCCFYVLNPPHTRVSSRIYASQHVTSQHIACAPNSPSFNVTSVRDWLWVGFMTSGLILVLHPFWRCAFVLPTGRPLRPGCGLQQDRPLLLHEGPGCLLPCQRPGLL